MKPYHLFIAIMVCSLLGALIGARTVKTIMLLISCVIATYGMLRLM